MKFLLPLSCGEFMTKYRLPETSRGELQHIFLFGSFCGVLVGVGAAIVVVSL